MRCIFQSAKLRTNTHTRIHMYSLSHTHTQSGWQAVFINYKLRADYTHYKRFFRATAASPSSPPSISLSLSLRLCFPLPSTTCCKLFN